MKGRLRIQEFMVIKPGGVPIFHFSVDGTRKLDELLSGFLSAITSFASEFGEKSVQSLSFEGSEIMYEQGEEGLLFVVLVDSVSPKKVVRMVLRDLSRKFQIRFAEELRRDIPIEEKFKVFSSDVDRALDFYENILKITSSLSPYVVPDIKQQALDIAIKSNSLLDDFHRDFGSAGTRILDAIDGQTPIVNLSTGLGLELDETNEIVEYLLIWGVVTISRLCPKLQENNVRFDAFLDIIGLPKKEYQLLNRAKPLCNGERSIVDISEKLSVTYETLYEMLLKLGDQVEWVHVPVVVP
ncbi:MAG: hypothetical protein ACFFED_16175 [Candidatus Thorarchaeota archaeon]